MKEKDTKVELTEERVREIVIEEVKKVLAERQAMSATAWKFIKIPTRKSNQHNNSSNLP